MSLRIALPDPTSYDVDRLGLRLDDKIRLYEQLHDKLCSLTDGMTNFVSFTFEFHCATHSVFVEGIGRRDDQNVIVSELHFDALGV